LAQADIGDGNRNRCSNESAKITLVKGDLQGIVKAKELSHAVMKILIKIYFLLSFIMYSESRCGRVLYPFWSLLSPMIAALAMSFSSVSVIAMHCDCEI
jgi:Cu2+-exporting ATPase